MYLRRNMKTKIEVSLDEPLNIDWDGNELLLSDILGTEGDMIYKQIEEEVERSCFPRRYRNCLPGKENNPTAFRAGRRQ